MEKVFTGDGDGVAASRAANASSEMRRRSGGVNSGDPLVAFLYVLVRDHIQPGVIEDIMRNNVEPGKDSGCEFSNGWLANYAKDIAARLQQAPKWRGIKCLGDEKCTCGSRSVSYMEYRGSQSGHAFVVYQCDSCGLRWEGEKVSDGR